MKTVKKVTIKDVASLAGVSVSTVSRVMNNTGYPVSADKSRRIRQSMRELNYSPNQLARNLRMNRSNLVALVVADIANPYFAGIAKAVDKILFTSGHGLIMSSTEESPDKEKQILTRLFGQKIDAIIISSTGNNEPLIEKFHNTGLPIILLDRNLEGTDLPFIGSNNVYESYMLTKYLIERGHRKILFLAGPQDSTTGRERFFGYRNALLENDIKYDEHLVIAAQFMRDEARRLSGIFLKENRHDATAVMSSNNIMTEGFLEAARTQSIKVPEDYSLVSFGSVNNQQLISPKITCYVQDIESIGQVTAQIVVQLLTSQDYVPSSNIINDTFVEGNSVRCL
jgi:LacI family transcriptional regulator